MRKEYVISNIREFVKDQFVRLGCTNQEAYSVIDALMLAEMCGEHSHGLRMLTAHAKKVARKGYHLADKVFVEIETSSFARVNCKNMIGMYTAKQCMEYAHKKVKENGLFVVFANNCNTYSAAFTCLMDVVERGYIGITMCNTSAQMSPYGGIGRLIGTNPIAFAIPTNSTPIIFDMATSKVAKSKISKARDNNEKIPEGWAFDKMGNPTTDPRIAMTGLLAPFADGPKGIGLAMMIDFFAGALSGASYLDDVGFFDSDRANIGQLFIVIDPHIVYGERYYEMVDNYIKKIKITPPQAVREQFSEGVYECRLPGENKYSKLKKSQESNTIFLDDSLFEEILSLKDIC